MSARPNYARIRPIPWHANREPVFAAMRKIDEQVQADWRKAQELGPRGTVLSVGSADFDYTLKATVGEAYLRALRQGKRPQEALATAREDGDEAVRKWNAKGSKARIHVTSNHELHRYAGSGRQAAEDVHRRFIGSIGKEWQC